MKTRSHEKVDSTFQLTTSHRGRQSVMADIKEAGLFQLTTSHRGRRWLKDTLTTSRVFQLTTSHRGRRKGLLDHSHLSHFNSLPHTEVDEDPVHRVHDRIISTHYLTQR